MNNYFRIDIFDMETGNKVYEGIFRNQSECYLFLIMLEKNCSCKFDYKLSEIDFNFMEEE